MCKRRRLKCDGLRPACSACKKSACIHGDDPTTVRCEYDDPHAMPPPQKRPRQSPNAKIGLLQAKVGALRGDHASAVLHFTVADAPLSRTTQTRFEQSSSIFSSGPKLRRNCSARPSLLAPRHVPHLFPLNFRS